MAQQTAFGVKLHTGWGALVAISGSPGKIQLHHRQRIELLPSDNSIPRFVYHDASEQPLAQAKASVERAAHASLRAAGLAIKQVLEELNALPVKVEICGVLSGSTSVPDDLSVILRSHPLIHAAEGALYQTAVASACESNGMKTVVAPERDVWARAAKAWRTTEAGLRKEVDALCKTAGAPWSADQKAAAAIALLALRSKRS